MFIVLFSVWVSGCGSALKRGWTNFTTYYNTYYNANEYFEEGRKVVEDQKISLDPERPAPIHHSPVSVGSESFEQAVKKCVSVLQEHPESKWADDALLLMGKSHYYLTEFITAIKRFDELSASDANVSLMQQAAIWKGRALLDLKDYEGGIAYLDPLLQGYPREWDAQTRAELQVLLGEYYAMLEDWEEASEVLSKALSTLSDRRLRGRTYFLYGQMLERENRFGEARYAYEQVPSYFPGTEYTYWANIKQADVARKQGNLEAALAIYRRLERNDKYVDRRNQLTFKIAHILQEQDKPQEAETLYRDLLYAENKGTERSLQADTYYQMGRLYSDDYQDFTMATAYFDTSSSLLNQDNRGADLMGSYRQYADLKVSIERADSLLWLGALSPEKLDSVIEEVKYRKSQQLLEEQQESEENRLQNRQALQGEEEDDNNNSTLYGFLNHKNQSSLNQEKSEFQDLWGRRPLVDNWRRQEALSQASNIRDNNLPPEKEESEGSPQVTLEPDLESIPKTEEERMQLQKEQLHAEYQLGNIFHLNFNKPDSAKKYYRKVIQSKIHHDSGLRARAMYALHELFKADSETDSVQYWQKRIIEEFPNSEYASAVAPNGTQLAYTETDSSRLRKAYQRIQTSEALLRPRQLRSLALDNQTSGLAPDIHFKAIEEYVQKAKYYQQLTEILSTETMPTDSTEAEAKANIHFPLSLLLEKEPYRSIQWDSVRTVLTEHDSLFSGSAYQSQVAALQQELKISTESGEEEWPTCKEEGITVQVQPNMQRFMEGISWPENVDEASLSGEVVYEFLISPTGAIQSYSLVSPPTTLGIEDALEEAFDGALKFKLSPPDKDITMVRCEVSFPINL
ncbi:tetratricopeptide repeat protein [Fodinibius salsisoli]|uniref:TonB C-terminal domain-containing protein n=1 Tax=Fodinibius salsisoli TaxID=2820877 RepID=A0ABT3PJ64_9BACT|nr:tetratricopeptide repeat protein [Fodinibius salsisoli]MCW9705944.1 hypothetical protein [Fodinibius salsisoli]